MKSFSELSLSAVLKSNLARHGFTEPMPVQAQAIEPALAGQDLVATAQTGTGKTLAFVLPMIQRLENGAFCLIDLGSRNGSFVSGHRVVVPVTLCDGDEIAFGETQLTSLLQAWIQIIPCNVHIP